MASISFRKLDLETYCRFYYTTVIMLLNVILKIICPANYRYNTDLISVNTILKKVIPL